MTSIYKPLIKMLLIPSALAVSIGFSAFTTVAQSEESQNEPSRIIYNTYSDLVTQRNYQPTSDYEKKTQNSNDRLKADNKDFSSNIIGDLNANNKNEKEV